MAFLTRDAGQRIPSAVRRKLGRFLDTDISNVLIHCDAAADAACSALGANAFALANHIYFARGRYRLYHRDGIRLLAHELVHTIQQRGTAVLPHDPLERAKALYRLEHEAELVARHGARRVSVLGSVAPHPLCEPTYPRRTTRSDMVRYVETILTQTRDTSSTSEMVAMWSRVASNFPATDSTGTLARRVWTWLFLKHFVDGESRPGVESIYPRYFYSHVYGWIDAQHFFGFIDFAEQQARTAAATGDAFNAATAQGTRIERDQQTIRDNVVLGAPPDPGPIRHMQIRAPQTPLFVLPRAAAGTATQLAGEIAAELLLRGTQGELFSLLNEERRVKFFLDSAKSAFSYEDIISNQLGTRFWFRYGPSLNRLPRGTIEVAFRTRLYEFLQAISVEDDPIALEQLARQTGLPVRERMLAATANEQDVRNRHPDLFVAP